MSSGGRIGSGGKSGGVLVGGFAPASAGGTIDDATSKELSNELSSMLQDEGLNTAIGGHIILGVRAKLPVIPFAVYVNGKYYFGGNYDDEIDAGHIVLEAGAGLAL